MIGTLAIGWRSWRAQWLSKRRLDALRSRLLVDTVNRAARLPFYREMWRGIDLTGIAGPGDLARLPVISRTDFRHRLDDIVAPGYDETNSVVGYTSGSSGATMRLLHDPSQKRYYNAAWIRAHMAYGMAPHHRIAYFRFEPAEAGITDRLGVFAAHHVPFTTADEVVARLKKIRPQVVGGYPSYFAELISVVPADELRGLGVRWVYVGAETVSAQLVWQLKRIFQCPVIDIYGSTEFDTMAFQCKHGSRHVCDDNMVLEIVDESGRPLGPGQVGDIVVTGLRNPAMPLVRYRIGDRGAWSDERCACGRHFTVLPRLEGRSLEAIVTSTGSRYPIILLDEDLIHIDTLYQFQVVQEAIDRVTLNLVCEPGTEAETVAKSVEALRAVFDAPMEITPQVVESIPRGAAGKVKAIVPL